MLKSLGLGYFLNSLLTDNIFWDIWKSDCSELQESKNIVRRIMNRDFYLLIGEILTTHAPELNHVCTAYIICVVQKPSFPIKVIHLTN